MEPTKVYGSVRFDITLNSMGYSQEDIVDLFVDPLKTLYPTKIGYQWYPSFQSPSFIEISLIVGPAIASVGGEFLKQLGKDLYGWTKHSLISVFRRKSDFGEAFIYLEFNDINVEIRVLGKDRMIKALTEMAEIIEVLQSLKIKGSPLEMKYSDGINIVLTKNRRFLKCKGKRY